MALTQAGERALRRMVQLDLTEGLIAADPTADQGIVPWDGRSPRDLTTVAERISLGHEGASLNEEDARIEEQCRRHLHGY